MRKQEAKKFFSSVLWSCLFCLIFFLLSVEVYVTYQIWALFIRDNNNKTYVKFITRQDLNIFYTAGKSRKLKVERLAKAFGINPGLAEIIWNCSRIEGVDPYLVAALIQTESSFNPKATSHKGYFGLMQIPYRVPYIKANIIIGLEIFKEKVRAAERKLKTKVVSLEDITNLTFAEKNVILEAIRLYKGYTKKYHMKRGYKQAIKVIEIALLAKLNRISLAVSQKKRNVFNISS